MPGLIGHPIRARDFARLQRRDRPTWACRLWRRLRSCAVRPKHRCVRGKETSVVLCKSSYRVRKQTPTGPANPIAGAAPPSGVAFPGSDGGSQQVAYTTCRRVLNLELASAVLRISVYFPEPVNFSCHNSHRFADAKVRGVSVLCLTGIADAEFKRAVTGAGRIRWLKCALRAQAPAVVLLRTRVHPPTAAARTVNLVAGRVRRTVRLEWGL
jgi:hypothetical protein